MKIQSGMLISALFIAAAVHCGGGDDSNPGSPTNDGGAVDGSGDSASSVGDGGSESGSPTITVNGKLVDSTSAAALPSRDVIVIDANGNVTKTVSGGDGTFHASGVVTPYDVGIPYLTADAATPGFPTYYAGITRPDPVVQNQAYDPHAGLNQYQAGVTFTATACGTCLIYVSTPTDTKRFDGAGGSTLYTSADDDQFQWYKADASALVQNVHVSIVSAVGQLLSTTSFANQSFVGGDNVALGTIGFTTVTSNNATITDTLPAGYTFSQNVLTYSAADGSVLGQNMITNAATQAQLPASPAGISTQVIAEALAPGGGNSDAFVTADGASATLAFTLPTVSTPLTPSDHSTGVKGTDSLTWSAASVPALYNVMLTAPTFGNIQIYTTDTKFDLSKLAKSEMALTAGGASYKWTAGGSTKTITMDDFVSPTPAVVAPSTIQYSFFGTQTSFTTQ